MERPLTSFSATISPGQGEQIRSYLQDRGFQFATPPHTHYSARSANLNVSFYQSGKLLVQGRGTGEFVEFFLEPQVLHKASVGYELDLDPEQLKPHIGVDESGKGDFFGPLVIAACFVDGSAARALSAAGIQDSKNIKSARRIDDLDKLIESTPGCVSDVVAIGNTAYNKLYDKFRNLNSLLAWGHARAIENVLSRLPEKAPAPEFILSDQFARSESTVRRALLERARKIKLIQRTRAESDVAVAAASIRARARFVRSLEALGGDFGLTLPKGASSMVLQTAARIARSSGPDALATISKTHFQTYERALAIAAGPENS